MATKTLWIFFAQTFNQGNQQCAVHYQVRLRKEMSQQHRVRGTVLTHQDPYRT